MGGLIVVGFCIAAAGWVGGWVWVVERQGPDPSIHHTHTDTHTHTHTQINPPTFTSHTHTHTQPIKPPKTINTYMYRGRERSYTQPPTHLEHLEELHLGLNQSTHHTYTHSYPPTHRQGPSEGLSGFWCKYKEV